MAGMMFITLLLIHPYLPDTIPIHWNAHEIDDYASKNVIYMYPMMLLFFNFIMLGARFIDPKKHNYVKFENTFSKIIWLMNISMTMFVIVMLYEVCNPNQMNMTTMIQMMIGFLICILGNWMPKIKQNFFIGIKTPWACIDENTWVKTHRFAGRIWFFGGLLWMLCACLPISSSLFQIVMLIILVGLPTIYSYVIYHHLEKEKHYD